MKPFGCVCIVLLVLLCSVFTEVAAQLPVDSLQRNIELEEIVISGSRFDEKKKNIIQKIDIIGSQKISRANAQNMGDLLISEANVFVQKSQQGGSSPVIRGFEASRVLLVVDGVRMNNAIYRSGHLQNIITVDQNMLERVEVLQGPSSTLFGSDALGGAVHMITKRPLLAEQGKKSVFGFNGLTRYSSANKEKTIHADINLGGKKWGFLSSMTISDFGDMRMGRQDKKGFEGFGTRPYYIKPFDGVNGDTILKNNNDRVQLFSGYGQTDIMQKILYSPHPKISHTLNIQHSRSSEIPRYDRLQDIRDGRLRFATWSYGPQERSLFIYNMQAKKSTGFFNEYNLVASYQDVEESRITREYKRYDRHDSRWEKVGVAGFTLDARRKFKRDELTAGTDLQINRVRSTAIRKNLINGTESKLDTRYPDGRNTMNYAGFYFQHIHKFKNNKWVLNDGLRLQWVSLYSSIKDNSFFQLPVTEVVQHHTALTGNIGIIYQPAAATRITLGAASGFRAPNIDDLGKIFESSTAARQVVVPNPDLKPEYTTNVDLGISHQWNRHLSISTGFFYTFFDNAIVKAPFQLSGQDSIIYYGVRSQVLASQNASSARLYGFNLEMKARAGHGWNFSGSFNLVSGNFKTDRNKPSSIFRKETNGNYRIVQAYVDRKPLDHIPPAYGKVAVQYEKDWGYAELLLLFNGWKKLDRYNADGEDNAQYATPKGSPAWHTLNIRIGYKLGKKWMVQASVDNLADRNYRYFASGFSAAGRNLSLSVRHTL